MRKDSIFTTLFFFIIALLATGNIAFASYYENQHDSCDKSKVSATFVLNGDTLVAPFTESFDAGTLPNLWDNVSYGVRSWSFGKSTPSSGTGPQSGDHTSGTGYFAFTESSNNYQLSFCLTTPIVNISTISIPLLTFYYHMYGATMGSLHVDIYDVVSDSWHQDVMTISGDQGNKWNIAEVYLTDENYGHLLKIRFRGITGSSFTSDIAIDDITVAEEPTCKPASIKILEINKESALLSWNQETGSQWNIEYGLSGFPLGQGTQISNYTNDSLLINGLSTETMYDVYIQSDCGSGDLSRWSSKFSFVTSDEHDYNIITDSLALVELYSELDGDNWKYNTNWLQGSLATWFGVTIENNRVTGLKLNANYLSGSIPPSIGDFSRLKNLDLSSNPDIYGTLPVEMGYLYALENLCLNNCALEGDIPLELSTLTKLKIVNMAFNSIVFSTFQGFEAANNLVNLYLNDCLQTGTIPEWISKCKSLTVLDLSYNKLTGGIELIADSLTHLTSLNLSHNLLYEKLPASIGNLSALTTLNIGYNQLFGEIPAELGDLSLMRYCYLNNNHLSGNLPPKEASVINQAIVNATESLKEEDVTDVLALDKSMAALAYLKLNNNKFTFSNLESLGVIPSGLSSFTYAAQDTIIGLEYIPSSEGLAVLDGKATKNTYQWYQESVKMNGETNDTLTSVDPNSYYYCIISNSDYPGLSLQSENYGSKVYNLESDSLALVAFYNASGGSGWKSKGNWLKGPVSTWYGVKVTNSRVTELALENNNLNGKISSEIGKLTELQILNIRRNYGLKQSIPSSIGNLTKLIKFDVYNDNLSGAIPNEIGNLTNLTYLDLGATWALSGEIPEEIGNLTNLTYLTIRNTQITGRIPASINNLVNLKHLDIADMYLSHYPMPDISALTNLTYLDFADCNFSDVSQSISGLANLETLRLSYNPFDQNLSFDMSQLTKLTRLELNNCQFRGEIPQSLLNNSIIEYLDISGNNFISGPIPYFGNMTNLGAIYASSCNFKGTIPVHLFQHPVLFSIVISDNQLTGTIPPEIGSMSQLFRFSVTNNQLSGSIPPEIGNLRKLSSLYLDQNQFSGTIPIEFGSLGNELWVLYLSDNKFTGPIPSSFGNLTGLRYCYMNNNKFSEDLPASFSQIIASVSTSKSQKTVEEPCYIDSIGKGVYASETEFPEKVLSSIYRLEMKNNKFTFQNFATSGLNDTNVDYFEYAPQDTVLAIDINNNVLTVIDGANSGNVYNWYKDNVMLTDQTRSINITEPGDYRCTIRNSSYLDLSLYSDTVYAEITSVDMDYVLADSVVESNMTVCFNAYNTITVAGGGTTVEIKEGASATLIAGQSVSLLPGFHAYAGSYCQVYITKDGTFCNDLPTSVVVAEPIVEKSTIIPTNSVETEPLWEKALKVYPNPNTGQFIVDLLNFNASVPIKVYNAMGKVVYCAIAEESRIMLDLCNVSHGIYFVSVVDGQNFLVQKIRIE